MWTILCSLQAGDQEKVVALMEAQGWWERLADFANNLDPRQGGGGLRAAAAAFSRAGRPKDVEACLRRLGDTQVGVHEGRSTCCTVGLKILHNRCSLSCPGSQCQSIASEVVDQLTDP